MKERPNGFLDESHINHSGEIFDYVRELHEYLWRFVRAEMPGASGELHDFVDAAVLKAEGGLLERFWVRRTIELSPDEKLLFTLVANLNGRKGFDWDNLDKEIKEEWLSEWLEIIRGDDDE